MTTITSAQSVVYSAVAQKTSLAAPVNAVSALPGNTGVQPAPGISPAPAISGQFIEASALYDASMGLAGLNSQLQVAQGGTQKITSILQNMQNIARQIAAGEGGSGDGNALASLEAEFQELYAQIDQTVSDTRFNGTSLLDGTFSPDSSAFDAGQNTSATQDSSSTQSTPSIIPDLGTQALFGPSPPGFPDPESADAALASVSGALGLANGTSSSIENISSQVDFAMASIETAQANNAAATSTLSESDGLISFIAEMISKPSVFSSAQTSKMPDSSLKLLGN
jgi:flagellin